MILRDMKAEFSSLRLLPLHYTDNPDIDVVIRTNGEGFIYPKSNFSESQQLAERLRLAIFDQHIEKEDTSIHMTISHGVGAWRQKFRLVLSSN
jgi:hypothetical protein